MSIILENIMRSIREYVTVNHESPHYIIIDPSTLQDLIMQTRESYFPITSEAIMGVPLIRHPNRDGYTLLTGWDGRQIERYEDRYRELSRRVDQEIIRTNQLIEPTMASQAMASELRDAMTSVPRAINETARIMERDAMRFLPMNEVSFDAFKEKKEKENKNSKKEKEKKQETKEPQYMDRFEDILS